MISGLPHPELRHCHGRILRPEAQKACPTFELPRTASGAAELALKSI